MAGKELGVVVPPSVALEFTGENEDDHGGKGVEPIAETDRGGFEKLG